MLNALPTPFIKYSLIKTRCLSLDTNVAGVMHQPACQGCFACITSDSINKTLKIWRPTDG